MTKRPSIKTCDTVGLAKLTTALSFAGNAEETRRALIFAAGALNNRKLPKGLGSMELSQFYEGRRAVDPAFSNPYWPDRD